MNEAEEQNLKDIALQLLAEDRMTHKGILERMIQREKKTADKKDELKEECKKARAEISRLEDDREGAKAEIEGLQDELHSKDQEITERHTAGKTKDGKLRELPQLVEDLDVEIRAKDMSYKALGKDLKQAEREFQLLRRKDQQEKIDLEGKIIRMQEDMEASRIETMGCRADFESQENIPKDLKDQLAVNRFRLARQEEMSVTSVMEDDESTVLSEDDAALPGDQQQQTSTPWPDRQNQEVRFKSCLSTIPRATRESLNRAGGGERSPARIATPPLNTRQVPRAAPRQGNKTITEEIREGLQLGLADINRPQINRLKRDAPIFSAKEDENFMQFKNEVKLYLEKSGLSALDQAKHLSRCLKDTAKDMWYSLPEEKQNVLETALAFLENEFMGEGYQERKSYELEGTRLNVAKNETPRTFGQRIERLINLCESDATPEVKSALAIKYFKDGLPADLRLMVKDQHPKGSAGIDVLKETANRLWMNRMNSKAEGFSIPAFNETSGGDNKPDDKAVEKPLPSQQEEYRGYAKGFRSPGRGQYMGPQMGARSRWSGMAGQNMGPAGNFPMNMWPMVFPGFQQMPMPNAHMM